MGLPTAMDSTVLSDSHVISISLSRATAPVEVREQLALQDWPRSLASLGETVAEWAILATCHRFELYVATAAVHKPALLASLQEILASVVVVAADEPVEQRQPLWHTRFDDEAVAHLCRVAAGLDSLVLGEAQIQGQVIATYTEGLESDTIGRLLSIAFRTAIRVGKRARTETAISTRAVSMSSVALSMAAHHVPDFTQARVLVIGAGEMSQLALKALLQRRVHSVTVANRTLARAEAVLLHPDWRAVDLPTATSSLAEYDIIFSATRAPEVVLTHDQVVVGKRGNGVGHTQVFIDLAVPRDIDPAVREIPDVLLVDVDDLQQGVDHSLAKRLEALPNVELIIDEELDKWRASVRELSMRPYVVQLRLHAEHIRQREVDRTLRFLGHVDAATRAHIDHLSHALVNKLLHEPTVRIKELAHHDDAEHHAAAICDIFGLSSAVDQGMDRAEPDHIEANDIKTSQVRPHVGIQAFDIATQSNAENVTRRE